MGCHHHMAVGLLWQQVHFFFVGFCYVLKQTERKSGMPCMLQWRWVCLPRYYKEQVWEGSSKARGGKKLMSRVKSAREKKGGRQSREGKGREDWFSSFWVCQSSRILAAGVWKALPDKSSFVTNARRFPSFPSLSVYGLLAHSRKLFFHWRTTGTRNACAHRDPICRGSQSTASPGQRGALPCRAAVCHLNTR